MALLAGSHPRGSDGNRLGLHQDLGGQDETCSLSVLKRGKVKAGVVAWSREVWMQGAGLQTSFLQAEQHGDMV